MIKGLNTAVAAIVLGGSMGIATAQEAAGQDTAAATEVPAAPADATPPPETVATVPVDATAAPDESAKAPAEERRGSVLTQEIVVTANRREEKIKDVPISISAFSPEVLEAKGVSAQQDLPKITPGLNVGNPVGFATTYIRGIGSDAFILADPLVVTYIDGVYFPSSTTQFQDFGDVERIEIDKGPQGTLFGRNALGGVISIQSKDPSFQTAEGAAKASYTAFTGSHSGRNARSVSGFFSLPLTDRLAISVSGLRSGNDPYYEQYVGPVGDHHLVADGYAYAYRLKAVWEPIDDLKVKLNYYHSYTNDPQRQFGANTDPSAGLGATLPTQSDPYGRTDFNDVPYSWDRTRNLFGTIDWNLPWFRAQLIGARQDIRAVRNADFDGTNEPVAYFDDISDDSCHPYCQPFFSKGDNAELRFLSNDFAPDWLTLVGGLYYYKQRNGVGGARFFGAGTDLSQGVIAGVVIPGVQNLYDTVLAPLQVNPAGAVIALKGGLRERSEAAYAQGTAKFTDWASLTLGVRAQQVKRSVLDAAQQIYVDGDTQIPIATYDGKDDPQYRAKNKSVDPKAVLSFHPGESFLGDDPLLYVSYQKASTGDTFNSLSLFAAPDKAKGSKLTAYEAGIKTYLFDHTMSLDAAIFLYDEKEPQIQVVSLQTGGAVHFENAQKLQIKGAEIGIVTPLFPSFTDGGLVFTLGACYLDSVYKQYENASGFNETTGIYSSTNDFSGNRVVQTPKLSGNTGLNQTVHWGDSTFVAGVDYYYNSGFYFYAQNTDNTKIPHYGTLGFTTSWEYTPWNTRVAVFGRNILNKHYLAARFLNDFGVNDYAAPGAMVGASLQWEF